MDDVSQWLVELGLGEYVAVFGESKIDMEILPDLTGDDLKELGIPLGHRKRILKAIADLSSPDGRDTAGETTSQLPASAPTAKHAERRHLTVMFCDLVGSTKLAERIDPEDLRVLIGAYQDVCKKAIEHYAGFVARYMGDGVLAYYGYPHSHEDDAERAVRGGLAVVAGVRKLDETVGADKGVELAVRVGIATGLVVVGDLIGEGSSQESPVVGETPNLAARLQSLAEPDTVIIAPSTRRLAGGHFDYQDLGARKLKGIADPVQAWRVVGESDVQSRFESARGGRFAPLVGRTEEITLLSSRWQNACEAEGQVVLISGEAGIGKSRLTEALHERIEDQQPLRLRYQCSPHHGNSALYPIITQIEHAAAIGRDDDSDTKLDKLESLLRQSSNDLGEDLPLLAALLSIPAGRRYSLFDMDAYPQKEKTVDALVRQFEGLANVQPLLCVFEDVHWIDPSTMELLLRLVECCESLAMLMVITCRPEFSAPWSGQPHTAVVSLSRMNRRDNRAMVEQLAGRASLPEALLGEIVSKTDGVPLFTEELTRALLDAQTHADAAQPAGTDGESAQLSIPETLQDSLMSRLDGLETGRTVAQTGAAIGRSFSHELLSAVCDLTPSRLDEALDELVTSSLVFRQGSGSNATYTFKHALVQDAAYQCLLRTARRDLHGRIATVLAEQLPTVVETQPELLARHASEAGFADQAVEYWLRAGERAAGRAAHEEAIGHFSQGLELLNDLDADTDRPSTKIRLYLGLAASMRVVDRLDEALEALDRAQKAAGASGRTADLAEVHYLRGNLYFPLGRIDDCLIEHERACDIARRAGLVEKEARALGGLGDAYYMRGRMITAYEHFDRCLELAHANDYASIETAYLPMRGAARYYMLDLDEALRDMSRSADRARELGHHRSEMVARGALSYLLFDMADAEGGQEQAEGALVLARQLGARRFESLSLMRIGIFLATQGCRKEAVANVEQAYSISRETNLSFTGPWVLGALALVSDDTAVREQALQEGEALLQQECVGHNYLHFYRDAMKACLRSGEWSETERYATALEEYTRAQPLFWCDHHIARGRALAAHGRGERSDASARELERLRAEAERVGLRSALPALDSALSTG